MDSGFSNTFASRILGGTTNPFAQTSSADNSSKKDDSKTPVFKGFNTAQNSNSGGLAGLFING